MYKIFLSSILSKIIVNHVFFEYITWIDGAQVLWPVDEIFSYFKYFLPHQLKKSLAIGIATVLPSSPSSTNTVTTILGCS